MLTVSRLPTPSWAKAAPSANNEPPMVKATAATRLTWLSRLASATATESAISSRTLAGPRSRDGSHGRDDRRRQQAHGALGGLRSRAVSHLQPNLCGLTHRS